MFLICAFLCMSLNVPNGGEPMRYPTAEIKHHRHVTSMKNLFRQGLNLGEIAERLNVSTKTLYRDLQRLRDENCYDAFIREVLV